MNRNQYYKQSITSYTLELLVTRKMENEVAITDISMNNMNNKIYICQANGDVKYM